MRASSLNRADLSASRPGISMAASAASGSRIGLECAGEVEAVGSEVKRLQARRPRDRLRRPAATPNMP